MIGPSVASSSSLSLSFKRHHLSDRETLDVAGLLSILHDQRLCEGVRTSGFLPQIILEASHAFFLSFVVCPFTASVHICSLLTLGG